MPKGIILLTLSALLLSCATTITSEKTYTPKMVQHIKGSIFKATDRGYYTTELVMKPSPPVVGDNKAQLIIHDYQATDIPGLDITVTIFMPEKGIESKEPIKVYDAGRGLYLLENINIPEPGKCIMRLTIVGPKETDTVVLDIPEVK